jgi:hypothetical protein
MGRGPAPVPRVVKQSTRSTYVTAASSSQDPANLRLELFLPCLHPGCVTTLSDFNGTVSKQLPRCANVRETARSPEITVAGGVRLIDHVGQDDGDE